jgi:ABC-type dipeptide/oligopeptide/nickel transport system permease component/ABC-type transport system substrate-binding protein
MTTQAPGKRRRIQGSKRRALANFGMALSFFLFVLYFFTYLCTPELSAVMPEQKGTDPAILDRNKPVTTENLVSLVRDVDYSEGEEADWYPKGESPMLAELVAEGKLPPVHERVGPEPVVVEGIEGIGKYGGTWQRVDTPPAYGTLSHRMSYSTWFRYSPKGFPIVPHIAKGYEVNEDGTEWIIHLRKGLRWSDGHPYTADSTLFWWRYIAREPELGSAGAPAIMRAMGEAGHIEKIDDYTLRFTFPHPYGGFLARMATDAGRTLVASPVHYLAKYHPIVGDQAVIKRHMQERGVHTKISVLNDVQSFDQNPELPSLWPWTYRRYSPVSPYRAVRNPYYYMVDTEGNQLPYIDDVLFKDVSGEMIPVACSEGESDMQRRYLDFSQYTLLMTNRKKRGYEVYHWHSGSRSWFALFMGIDRKVEEGRPETTWKRKYLGMAKFRQALALAINREPIIEAEYEGLTEPANDLPGPASLFYDEKAHKLFTEHDPERANALLDEIGLTNRDSEGLRTWPDGSTLTLFMNYTEWTGGGACQFIIDDWHEVGIRAVQKPRSRQLFSRIRDSRTGDVMIFEGLGHYYPMAYYALLSWNANRYDTWYELGGLYGSEAAAASPLAKAPPPAMQRSLEIYDQAFAKKDIREQAEIYRGVQRIAAEQQWTINICTPTPVPVVVKNGFRNVPREVVATFAFLTPGNAGMETYFFDNPQEHTTETIKEYNKVDVISPTVQEDWPIVDEAAVELGLPADWASRTEEPGAGEAAGGEDEEAIPEEQAAVPEDEETAPEDEEAEDEAAPTAADTPETTRRETSLLATLIKWLVALAFLGFLGVIVVRRPYIGRRVALMAPTLLIVSVVAFVVIQLPPGNYLDQYVMRLQEQGDAVSERRLEEIRQMFWLDEPWLVRYTNWLGLNWFLTFDNADKGLLQGFMGRSMKQGFRPVNQLVGDRILLTMGISLGTILFSWCISFPVGIYSAVKQYSVGDYIVTTLGFMGLCIPSFLLALLFMYASSEWFDEPLAGLFSPEYANQIGWSWLKFVDLLKHIWMPIVILGVVGTAGGIRTMRANLLDELRKPYVVTARAKGVRPFKLLIKYPVRMALNPFISGIGNIFPALVSGGSLVAVVMRLPTVGPLMLDALRSEDMYLAGSMLMVLSLLTIFGTLVSDLLLLVLDPRIRYEGGTR